jgi:phosphoribosylformylglycinamidine (FGAM) synthase-like enzyme
MRPFSHNQYAKNDRENSDGMGCAHCGRYVKRLPETVWAHVVDGGAAYGNEVEVPGDAGDMGWFPVGPTCAKLLKKQGVFLQVLS